MKKRAKFGEADVAVALFVLGRAFRMSVVGTRRFKIAECGGFTITTCQHFEEHYPMVLTVDAPDRVLEAKFMGRADWSVVIYSPGPWEAKLLAAAKSALPSVGLDATGQRLN